MNTSSATIRHKLYGYIRVADNKRFHAIYNLLESEIEQTNEWWKEQLVKELDNRYQALKTGTDTGFPTSQLIESIYKLRTKKYGK